MCGWERWVRVTFSVCSVLPYSSAFVTKRTRAKVFAKIMFVNWEVGTHFVNRGMNILRNKICSHCSLVFGEPPPPGGGLAKVKFLSRGTWKSAHMVRSLLWQTIGFFRDLMGVNCQHEWSMRQSMDSDLCWPQRPPRTSASSDKTLSGFGVSELNRQVSRSAIQLTEL